MLKINWNLHPLFPPSGPDNKVVKYSGPSKYRSVFIFIVRVPIENRHAGNNKLEGDKTECNQKN